MDITIQREALLKPLQAVSGMVDKKQTLPILSNVLLTIKNNQLCLIGTDLEIELIGFVNTVSLSSVESTTVSARKLFDICRTLPEGALLRLSLEKKHLLVRALESCFMLNTLPPGDFPDLDDSHYPTQFTMKQNHFKSLLTKTYFAMGQQDVRHYLNGAFLDIRPNMIKCVAADGHRLALTTIQDDQIGQIEVRIILPRKSVLELIRLFGNETNQDIAIRINDNRFQLITPDFIFTSKLINAQYPDYNRLIPQRKMTAVGDAEAIKQALTRASILSNEKFRGVRFQLETNKLCITANNSDQEQAEEALMLQYEGNNIEIGFNVAYLLDVVSAVMSTTKGKGIRFSFTDTLNGVLIEPTEGDNSLYVVMPMRL
jgi:DNA polymerase-3 subunit beta